MDERFGDPRILSPLERTDEPCPGLRARLSAIERREQRRYGLTIAARAKSTERRVRDVIALRLHDHPRQQGGRRGRALGGHERDQLLADVVSNLSMIPGGERAQKVV